MANSTSLEKQLLFREQAFQMCMGLDLLEWELSDQMIKNGSIDDKTKAVFAKHISAVDTKYQQLSKTLQKKEVEDSFGASESALLYLGEKISRMQKKYSAQPVPMQTTIPPRIIPQKGCGKNDLDPSVQRPQSPRLIPNVSFKISDWPAQSQPAAAAPPSISTTLNRMSFLLRNNNEAQAIKECVDLPETVKHSIFGALWVVCGAPLGNHQMADPNFGEVSFFNWKPKCTSTLHQKACAIELVKTQNILLEMITLLHGNKFEQAQALFPRLPQQVKDQIQVSFLSSAITCAKKAQDLNQYVSLFKNNSVKAQGLVQNQIALFKGIDEMPNVTGSEKNGKKIEAIHAFSRQIIEGFFGEHCRYAIPVPKQRPSFKGLAADYATMHPILRPFLLQLVNDLRFDGEQLENIPQVGQGARKSSVPQDPQLGAREEKERRAYRVKIVNETIDSAKAGYINSQGQKVTFNLNPAIQSLELVPQGVRAQRNHVPHTKLFLDNRDCLTVTRECFQRGLNPIVLDAASDGHFGGGYMTGAGAQEEYLCRASGLSVAVDPIQGLQQKNNFYPLSKNGDAAGLYVANVPVFRGEENQGYPYLDEPFDTAVAIVAAYNFGNNTHRLQQKDGKLCIPDHLIEGTKAKIRTILHMAEKHGHQSVVLMPLGCGAFGTPPHHMCDLMLQVIVQEFPHSFEEIHIAAIDDHNTGKPHNLKGNVAEFKQMIGYFERPFKEIGMSFQPT